MLHQRPQTVANFYNRPSHTSAHDGAKECWRSVEAPRVDYVLDASPELRRTDEGATLGLSRERSCVDLPDPELHAVQVTAAAQERVVQVAHELPRRAIAAGVLAARGEAARNCFHLREYRTRARALRRAELAEPERKAAGVRQATEDASIEVDHHVDLRAHRGVAEDVLCERGELAGED